MSLKNVFGRKPPVFQSMTELDSEQLGLKAALEYVRKDGNLDTYPGSASERRALLTTAVRRGLVAWDRRRERYELTGTGKTQHAVLIPNAASLGESGTASDNRSVPTDRLGRHSPAADERRRRAKITPITAVAMLAACAAIAAGVYFGPMEVKVNSPVAADMLPESTMAPLGGTTATAAAAMPVGDQGMATGPGSTANTAVAAAETKSSESALRPAPRTSTDVGPSRQPWRSRAEGPAHSTASGLATDETGPRYKSNQKHHRQHYARHNRGYRSRLASEGLQGDTPPGWYWQPQF